MNKDIYLNNLKFLSENSNFDIEYFDVDNSEKIYKVSFINRYFKQMGKYIYPVAITGIIDYCDEKGLSYNILETSSAGFPTKLEVSARLKPLITQMGQPLKLSSGTTNDMVVISYR